MVYVSQNGSLAEELADHFNSLPLDRDSVPQSRLNLEHRDRVSLLPWRGQFSPEFIDVLLSTYVPRDDVILDPFAGSGTTLIESGRRGHVAYGMDINPAAVYLARTAELMNVHYQERSDIFRSAQELLINYLGPFCTRTIFNRGVRQPNSDLTSTLRELMELVRGGRNLETIIANALMQAMGNNGGDVIADSIFEGFYRYQSICQELPYSQNYLCAVEADARCIPLERDIIDAIITSPPYINVFNYHQNYRRAMELLGWDLLEVSKSEIGANRKNRQNRFLTVVQYCLDMLDVLKELHRILKPSGKLVIVVGRESNVRGQSFENGKLLYCLSVGGTGFRLMNRHERVFVNRFGVEIFEDILVLSKDMHTPQRGYEFAREVARHLLSMAWLRAPESIRCDIARALADIEKVEPSPKRSPADAHLAATPIYPYVQSECS